MAPALKCASGMKRMKMCVNIVLEKKEKESAVCCKIILVNSKNVVVSFSNLHDAYIYFFTYVFSAFHYFILTALLFSTNFLT